ncbi:MAG: hypothetical protein ISS34_02995 [Candidatus Omnitrophica bacterium]|nr:hypothetical protein [Candidatus Omnitrophota bacterium]
MKKKDLFNNINNILDTYALREILIFANTPMYLYRHFKQNISVRDLSKRHSSTDLIKYFEHIVKQLPRDLNTLIYVYASIIALTFKESPEAMKFFIKLDEYKFKWTRELKYIYISTHKSTHSYIKTIEPKMVIQQEAI